MKAYYRGYQRAGQAKVHIVRTTPVRASYRPMGIDRHNIPQAWCGVIARDATNSPAVDVDPSKPLDAGLTWCGSCLGRAAEQAGLLAEVAALLIAKEAASC